MSVIGTLDSKRGEAVHAIVILREGASATEEELTAHVLPILANYKRPRSYSFRAEPFWLSGAGKVLRTELRKPFWEGQGSGVS